MNKLAILIPNYNGAKFILNTIGFYKSFFPSSQIIVVDDSSTDNSVEILKSLDIILIQKNSNGGFASSVNVGLNYLLKTDFKYILVSNSDVVLTHNSSDEIKKSISLFECNSKLGVLGFIESDINNVKTRIGSDISGFLFCLTLEVVKNIGFLDERFFMYGEEQDYFRRVLRGNFEILQTNIYVGHSVEGSGKSKLRNSWLSIRNSIFLEAKDFNLFQTLKKIAVLFLLINKIYKPKAVNDPSLNRIYRPGIFLGNIFLISAIFWNIFAIFKPRTSFNEP